MIVFWDTSAFVPLIVTESGTVTAQRLWALADRVIASRLLYVEAVAALAMAHRMRRLDRPTHRASREAIQRLCGSVDWIEVTPRIVQRAADLAELYGLRGYDAVQCASAEAAHDNDTVVASGDQDLLSVCQKLGLNVATV